MTASGVRNRVPARSCPWSLRPTIKPPSFRRRLRASFAKTTLGLNTASLTTARPTSANCADAISSPILSERHDKSGTKRHHQQRLGTCPGRRSSPAELRRHPASRRDLRGSTCFLDRSWARYPRERRAAAASQGPSLGILGQHDGEVRWVMYARATCPMRNWSGHGPALDELCRRTRS